MAGKRVRRVLARLGKALLIAGDGEVLRTEVTKTGCVVIYRRNDQGGEDVEVVVPSVRAGAKAQPLGGK